MRTFIALLFLIAGTAWARPQWPNLEMGQAVRLTQDFVFPNGFTVKGGATGTITDMTDLGIGAVLFEVTPATCSTPDVELEVEIFPVPTEIGLSVQPNCILWFFVSNEDLYTEAPLE